MRNLTRIILAVMFCVATSARAAEADSLRVLWVGNSLTYFNDLPAIVQDIAASQGLKLSMTRVLKGGEQLSGHWANPRLKKLLKEQRWDYIVLQEQSQLPGMETDVVAREVYPYAHKIDSLAHVYSPQAHTIYYMTFAHKYGNVDKTDYTLDDTYDLMQMRLATSYLEMAYQNNSWCAPVGWAWEAVRKAHPEFQLHLPDCLHPSPMGSYLAANVIFTTIIGRPYQTDVCRDLTPEQAEVLQQTAQQTVLQNLKVLNIRY